MCIRDRVSAWQAERESRPTRARHPREDPHEDFARVGPVSAKMSRGRYKESASVEFELYNASAALRAVSCSAPDLIELSSRLPVDDREEQEQDADDQVPGVTSFPVSRHGASQSTAVVYAPSPSRRRRRTINDE